MAGGSGGDALSPRLAELASPAIGALPPAGQAKALGLAGAGPGSLLRRGNRVLVEVRYDHGAVAGLDDLRSAGAEVIHASRRYQTVTVAAKPLELSAVGGLPGVAAIKEVLTPMVYGTACGGSVISEGDSQLGANVARSAFGLDGEGVKVGILSDSFDNDATAPTHAAQDVASGDLPGPGNPCGNSTAVELVDDSEESEEATDEGRGMAQIVHDIAPGASLAFATAFSGETGFAANIKALASKGAKVIVDDVGYFEEPFFQDGPVATAVNEVAAAGVAYFSAAGNDNLIENEKNIASWEAPAFRDSLSCPASLLALPGFGAGHCMDFNPNPALVDDTFGITVEAGATLIVDLQWAQPWAGVTTDLDAYLLDSLGEPLYTEVKGKKILVTGAEDNVGETQEPFEFLAWENETGADQEVQLAINDCVAACNPNPKVDPSAKPRLKFILLQNGGGVAATEYPESAGGDVVGPTIFGHAGAEGAVGVGAIRYNTTVKPEPFSSRGPVTHYFGPVTGSAPAAKLPVPQAVAKPDLVATDGGATTFFGQLSSGVWRFFGTSAAAPHAAGVAALMRQANPTLSVSQLRAALAQTARPVGSFGANDVGAGMVNAYGAVSSVLPPPTVKVTEAPAALSRNDTPHIGFGANRPVSFTCALDGGALVPCSSPFVPSQPLDDGLHGFAVRGVDAAGLVGTSETVYFKIDTRPPHTFFARRPPRTVRTRHRRVKAVFRFGSNEEGVRFICRVDTGLFRFCPVRLVRRFRVGSHTVRVKAVDQVENVDPTPAVYHFRVKQRRR